MQNDDADDEYLVENLEHHFVLIIHVVLHGLIDEVELIDHEMYMGKQKLLIEMLLVDINDIDDYDIVDIDEGDDDELMLEMLVENNDAVDDEIDEVEVAHDIMLQLVEADDDEVDINDADDEIEPHELLKFVIKQIEAIEYHVLLVERLQLLEITQYIRSLLTEHLLSYLNFIKGRKTFTAFLFSIVIPIFFHTLPVMPKMASLNISFINVKSYEFTETYRRGMTKGLQKRTRKNCVYKRFS